MNFSKKWIRFFDLPLAKQDEIRRELTLPDAPTELEDGVQRVRMPSSGFLELVKQGHEIYMLFAYTDEKIIGWIAKIHVYGVQILMFFTRVTYRRQGIAKRLAKIAAGITEGTAIFHGWNEASVALQQSVQGMFEHSVVSTVPTHQL